MNRLEIMLEIMGLYFIPVQNPPQSIQMSSALVLVVKVVGVLPDVEGEDGAEAVGDGIVGVGVLGDGELAGGGGLEPNPATTEKAYAFGFEVGFERIDTSPLFHYLLSKRRSRVKPGMRDTRGHDELGEVHIVV